MKLNRAKFCRLLLAITLSAVTVGTVTGCVPTRSKKAASETSKTEHSLPSSERRSPNPTGITPSRSEKIQIRIVRDSSDQSDYAKHSSTLGVEDKENSGVKLPLPHFAFETHEGSTVSPNGVIIPPGHESTIARPAPAQVVADAEKEPLRAASKAQAPASIDARKDIFERSVPVPPTADDSLAAKQPEARAGLSRPGTIDGATGVKPVTAQTAALKRTPITEPSDRNRQIFAAVMAVLVVLLIACMVLVKTEKSEEEQHNLPSNRRF